MSDYSYQDHNDLGVGLYIAELELEPGAWARDEERVLTVAKSYLPAQGQLFVDAGCGTGRLIPEFAVHFGQVIAVELDADRIEEAKELVEDEELEEKVVFQHCAVQDMQVADADAALSSHVIQHVCTEDVPAILHTLAEALKPGGILIVTTNFTVGTEDVFMKEWVEDGHSVDEIIEVDEFEEIAATSGELLPVHYFALDGLTGLLGAAGFAVLERLPFHPTQTNPEGVDVLVVAKKQG